MKLKPVDAYMLFRRKLLPMLGSLLSLGAAAQTAPAANALPTGGQVSAGQASVSQSGANMLIQQGSNRAAINWQSFNVGSNAQVQFQQPSSSSVMLNRVMSSDPSQIFGRITANGQIILTNPQGVYFGKDARVDVGGIIATTHGISDADFMAGKNRFERNGSTASVVNDGELKAGLGGYIALLAPEVRNQGAIIAQMGTVALAAGEAIDLHFDGNNRLTSIRVEPSQIQALVDNRHAVQAPGGLIVLSAQSMDRLVGGVVRNSGRIEANGLQQQGGRILLTASHKVENTGSISANAGSGIGSVDSGPAGKIEISAPEVINSGVISALGNALSSAGSLLVQATNFTQTASARIDLSAPQQGGTLSIQTAGKVQLQGQVDASATQDQQSHGGQIDIAAQGDIQVGDATLDASGGQGGQIQLRAAVLTQNDNPNPLRNVPNAPGQGRLAILGNSTLSTRGRSSKGGLTTLLGDHIELLNTTHVDATGATGGGTVLVGGDWQGRNGIYQATSVTMAQGVRIDASATDSGDGGKVVLWSDVHNENSLTTVKGGVLARGGANGGNGGQIETSGHRVEIDGFSIDTLALQGQAGLWLIDPYDYTINSAQATTISNALNSSSVEITTASDNSSYGSNSNNSSNGDITVNNSISKTGSAATTLTLKAARHISLNSAATISASGGALNVQFWADSDDSGDGIILFASPSISTNGGWLKFGNNQTASINGVTTVVGGDVFFSSGLAQTISTGGGAVTVYGESILANTSAQGVTINAASGAVTFTGLLNTGNQYTFVDKTGDTNHDWDWAFTAARNGTAGGGAVGDSYLVSITSRLENAIAGLTAGYRGAWIGAYRPSLTSGAWTLADGPERGTTFFTQTTNGSGGTASPGYYANFGTGEPNGLMTGASTENVGQFFGTAGQWNDLVRTTQFSSSQNGNPYAVLGYVRETNLAASPLTITGGTLTISGSVGAAKALASLSVTANSTTINGNVLVTTGTQTYNNALTVNATGDLRIAATTLSITGASQALLFKATGSITHAAGMDVSTNGGAVTYWADSDNNSTGNITLSAGTSADRTTITSGGGAITLGGGTAPATDSAWGSGNSVATEHGINLDSYSSLNAGNGAVSLRGASSAAVADYTLGVRVYNNSSIAGDSITIVGDSTPNDSGNFGNKWGVGIISSSLTGSGTISITGTGGGASGSGMNNYGTWVQTGSTITATGSGTINITGTGGTNSGGAGVQVSEASAVRTSSGALTLTGTGGNNASTSVAFSNATIGQTSQTGAITLNGDVLYANSAAPSSFLGSGTLALAPLGTSFTASWVGIYDSWNLASTLTGLTLGKAGNIADITVARTTSIAGPISIYGANVAINAALTATGTNTITLKGSGSITQTAAVSASNLLLLGGNVLLTNAGNAVATLAASGVGSLSYTDSNALTLGNVSTTNGISASGAVSIGTQSLDLTVAQNLATTDTTSSALTLNAGIGTAAGTSAGGNIIISGSPTISVGSGGIAKLYSGSVSGSTGLTAWVGLGSGRFRYYSDEAAANYTSALVTGLYGIYRERPATTATLNASTMTYGDTLPTLGSTTSLVNGDTASFEITGRTNASSGNISYKSSAYAVTNTNLAASGYNVTVATPGTLKVNQKSLTLSGFDAANKEYDRSTTATIVNAGELSGVIVGDTVTVANTGASFSDKNVGTGKTVTLNGVAISGTDAGNYSIATTATDTANITAKAVTFNASKTYDGTTDLTGKVTVITGVDGETLTYTSAVASDAHVATVGNYITGISLGNQSGASSSTGGLASNYQLPTLNAANVPVSITAKTLTPTLSNTGVTKSYDGTANTPTDFTPAYGFSGLVTGDTSATLTATGMAYNDKNVAAAHQITVSGLGISGITGSQGSQASDYVLDASSKTVSAVITRAALSVLANDDANFVTLAQTGTGPYAGVSYSGFVGGETQNTAGVLTAGAIARSSGALTAGTYTADLVPSGWSAANYNLSYVNGNYTIVPANQLLVKVSPVQNTYGAATRYMVTDALYLASDNTTIANLTSSVSAAGTNNNTITISDGSSSTASFTLAPSSANNSTAGKLTVGSYQLAATGVSGSTANFSNTITVVGSHQVDAAALTASASAGVSKEYDGTTAMNGVTVNLTGKLSNDVTTVSGTGAFGSKNAGTSLGYTISNLALSGTDAANYYLSAGDTLSGSNGTITRKTVSLGATSKTYDGTTDLTGKVTVITGVDAETLTYTGAMASDAHVATDSKYINALVLGDQVGASSVFGGLASNYQLPTLNAANAPVSITAKTLTATLSNTGVTKVYDGTTASAIAPTYTFSGLVSGDTAAALSNTGAVYDSAHVVSASKVTVSGLAISGITGSQSSAATDYVLDASAKDVTASITAKAITLTAPTATKVYDGQTTYVASAADLAALSAALGVSGDAVSGISLTYDDKNVGTSKTLAASHAAIADGSLGGNYTISYASNTQSSISRLSSVTWVGGISGYWFDPANWAGGAVPDLSNVANVVIPSGVTVSFGGTVVSPAQGGAVNLDGLTGAGGNLSHSDGTLNVGTGGITLGSLTQSGGALTNMGSTTLVNYTQSGGSYTGTGPMTVGEFAQTGGTTLLSDALTVTQDFSQGSLGSVSVGGNTRLTDTNGGAQLGNLNSTGVLTVNSTDGAITQAPATVITTQSTSSFLAAQGGSPADIALSNMGNDFHAAVGLNGRNVAINDTNALALGIVSTTGNLTLTSNGALNLGTSTVGGNASANSGNGDITQSGAFRVGGTTTLLAGTGAVNLFDLGNLLTQGVTVVASSSNIVGDSRKSAGTAEEKVQGSLPATSSPGFGVPTAAAPAPLVLTQNVANTATADSAGSGNQASAGDANNAGITIDLREAPISSASIMAAVSLPKGTATAGTGFSFELPESIRDLMGNGESAQLSLPDGRDLPAWLRFNAQTLSFEAAAVPNGAFPLQLALSIGGQRVMVVISERVE